MTRLTAERLASYTYACAGNLDAAIALYDWNSGVGGALLEDLGRIEIVLRNAFDATLLSHGKTVGWSHVWYDRHSLFPGRDGQRAIEDIASAKRRALRGGTAVVHGSVISELTFGFWRYLCTPAYLTSLWVPILASACPNHPAAGSPRQVRADVEDSVQRLHFLCNRVAHHEPLHQRDLLRDHSSMTELIGWICPVSQQWFVKNSRSFATISTRPIP